MRQRSLQLGPTFTVLDDIQVRREYSSGIFVGGGDARPDPGREIPPAPRRLLGEYGYDLNAKDSVNNRMQCIVAAVRRQVYVNLPTKHYLYYLVASASSD